MEGEGVLVMPQYLPLHKALWERQQSALRRAQADQVAVAEAAKEVGPPGIRLQSVHTCFRFERSMQVQQKHECLLQDAEVLKGH